MTLEYAKILSDLDSVIVSSHSEWKNLSESLSKLDEEEEVYSNVLGRMKELADICKEAFDARNRLILMSESRWKKGLRKLMSKLDEIDINLLIKIAGIGFLIKLIEVLEKQEEPVMLGRSFASKTIPFGKIF